MKMNRIQFQRGLSLSDFIADYGTEERCATAVESARWPTGFTCPKCGNKRHSSYLRGNVKVFQCSICRKQTTLTEDTVFHSTKLPLTKWFQAMYLLTQTKNNISSLQLKRMIGVSYRTAWLVKHKLMQIMFEQEQTTKLSGRVEVDDAFSAANSRAAKEVAAPRIKYHSSRQSRLTIRGTRFMQCSLQLKGSAKKRLNSGPVRGLFLLPRSYRTAFPASQL